MSGGMVLTPTSHPTSEGISVGSDQGISVADWVGILVGSEVGVKVGSSLGTPAGLDDVVAVGGLVGISVGAFVGVVDGVPVENDVGYEDGEAVGLTDGSPDAISVGRLLGENVSVIVGTPLGFSDTATLGLLLGDLVGNGVNPRDGGMVEYQDGSFDTKSVKIVLGTAVLVIVGTVLCSSQVALPKLVLGLPEGDIVSNMVEYNDGDAVVPWVGPFDVASVGTVLGVLVLLAIVGTAVGSSETWMLALALGLPEGEDIVGTFVSTKVGN